MRISGIMGKERLKGMPLDFCGMAWDYANEYIRDKPDLVAIPELDSGYPQIMTKEQAKQLADIWEACRPKTNIDFGGKFLIYGTGGEMDNGSFEDIFYNPKND